MAVLAFLTQPNYLKLQTIRSKDELNVFMDYGNSEIEKLAEQYWGTVASIRDCFDERSSYRQFLKDSCNHGSYQ